VCSIKDLDIVVETRQRLDEHVGSFVGELVASGGEKVQRLIEIEIQMPKMTESFITLIAELTTTNLTQVTSMQT